MPCISAPVPTVPDPPDGITLAASLPSFSGSLELCCKIASLPVSTPPVALPPGTISALAPLNAILDAARDFLDGQLFPCPKE